MCSLHLISYLIVANRDCDKNKGKQIVSINNKKERSEPIGEPFKKGKKEFETNSKREKARNEIQLALSYPHGKRNEEKDCMAYIFIRKWRYQWH